MEFISYCSVTSVTSAVGKKSSFLGSTFNFSGTTSSDVRHTAYFPANEIKSSAGSTVQREALPSALLWGLKGHLESPFASLHVAYTVESEEQGERLERIYGSCPTMCCLHKCTIVPTHMVHSACVLRIALPPCFTGSNKTLLKRERKVG